MFSFFSNFSSEIWFLVIAAYIGNYLKLKKFLIFKFNIHILNKVVSLILLLIARLSPVEEKINHCNFKKDFTTYKFSAHNSFWFAFGTLVKQITDVKPKTISVKFK